MNSEAVIAVASILAVLVTAVYAFFTWRLWQETRRQAITTQRMFEASQRPYVSVDVAMDAGTSPRLIRLVFALLNHGAVPAIVTEWDVILHDGEEILARETRSTSSGFSLCLFPSRDEIIKLEFEEKAATHIWGSRDAVRLRVTVRYRGVFEHAYMTRVATRLSKLLGTLAERSTADVVTEGHEVE